METLYFVPVEPVELGGVYKVLLLDVLLFRLYCIGWHMPFVGVM